jgi:DNA-binding MarR family transcriptional regulator
MVIMDELEDLVESIRYMYEEKGLSGRKIAKEMSLGKTYIYDLIEEYDIEKRSPKELAIIHSNLLKEKWKDPDYRKFMESINKKIISKREFQILKTLYEKGDLFAIEIQKFTFHIKKDYISTTIYRMCERNLVSKTKKVYPRPEELNKYSSKTMFIFSITEKGRNILNNLIFEDLYFVIHEKSRYYWL